MGFWASWKQIEFKSSSQTMMLNYEFQLKSRGLPFGIEFGGKWQAVFVFIILLFVCCCFVYILPSGPIFAWLMNEWM